MAERTNQQRADRALAALKAFKAVESETVEYVSEDVTDLLTDLHHYLHRLGNGNAATEEVSRCMHRMMETAANHFTEEQENES